MSNNDYRRKKHNEDIMRKFLRGESLLSKSTEDCWWPDRSKGFIKKDPEALEKLYGIKKEEKNKPSLSVVKKEV